MSRSKEVEDGGNDELTIKALSKLLAAKANSSAKRSTDRRNITIDEEPFKASAGYYPLPSADYTNLNPEQNNVSLYEFMLNNKEKLDPENQFADPRVMFSDPEEAKMQIAASKQFTKTKNLIRKK